MDRNPVFWIFLTSFVAPSFITPKLPPPGAPPLPCLRSHAMLSWLHGRDLVDGKHSTLLSGTAFQLANLHGNSIVRPCLRWYAAVLAFAQAIDHSVVALLAVQEGNGDLLGRDAITQVKI